MLNNRDIAKAFQMLGTLMELHDENPFKIRSYQNAYISLRKLENPLVEMSDEEIGAIKGLGKSIVSGIRELQATGKLTAIEALKDKTPDGIVELLGVKGLGPKKIRTVWQELGVTSPGELLYACEENRLIELKGFGLKTQEELKQKIRYFLDSQDKLLFAQAERIALQLIEDLEQYLKGNRFSVTGELRRCCPVVDTLELVTDAASRDLENVDAKVLRIDSTDNGRMLCTYRDSVGCVIHLATSDDFQQTLFRTTGSADFLASFPQPDPYEFREEEAIFKKAGVPFLPPEMREDPSILDTIDPERIANLVTTGDLRGVLHNHSTYSDGLHTLEDMAEYVRSSGYEYLGMSDHSKSAFYANGLEPGRVLAQFKEIDALNTRLAPFKVFKGIESDILADGSLDYEQDLLEQFDFIVASIHSNLRMDEDKATARLIAAVENPYTRILGHPTGRLLLSRKGYPVDHTKLIDACAANRVVIELNANPLRLDLDYRWIPYALEKGVMIAINPDAHSKEAIHQMRYGVLAARKAGLTAAECLNCLSLAEFEKWIGEK